MKKDQIIRLKFRKPWLCKKYYNQSLSKDMLRTATGADISEIWSWLETTETQNENQKKRFFSEGNQQGFYLQVF